MKVVPMIHKDTSQSSHTPRTPLSRPLQSNQHADTPHVRKESTSHSTSAINSPITTSTPGTKKTLLVTPETNCHVPVSPSYHESPVSHQSDSYMDLLCEDEDSSTQNLSTLLSSAIRQSYNVESLRALRNRQRPLRVHVQSVRCTRQGMKS